MSTKQPPRSVFDGFCHRPYDEEFDGWMLEQPEEYEYPSIQMARDILMMFQEIQVLRRENWQLKKRAEKMKW